MLETELYEPVKKLFEESGYAVNAEVCDCDMIAEKGEETIIIELKKSINLKLVHQIIKRQSYFDYVYAAIMRPKISYRSKRWLEILALIKRLEAGLIVVSESEGLRYAEIAVNPATYVKRQNKRMRKKINFEISGRTIEYNKGGSSRKSLMTAYKENALFIACCLELKGDMKTREIRKYQTGDKTSSILAKNFYGWFEKKGDGFYGLSDSGQEAILQYPELSEHYYNKIKADSLKDEKI